MKIYDVFLIYGLSREAVARGRIFEIEFEPQRTCLRAEVAIPTSFAPGSWARGRKVIFMNANRTPEKTPSQLLINPDELKLFAGFEL